MNAIHGSPDTCRFCDADVTKVAYRHPETGHRYCSPEHASEYFGLASAYVVDDEHDESTGIAFAFDEVPAQLVGHCVPARYSIPFDQIGTRND